MGSKYTVELSRAEVEAKFRDLFARLCTPPVIPLKDEALEEALLEMNDRLHNGEGYENYWVKPPKQKSKGVDDMGVKSTVELTRNQAEQKYYDLLAKLHNDRLRVFSNTELEILLEEMNDKAHDGEGFESYLILED